MKPPRLRSIGLALACCTVATACSDDSSQPFTTPNATMVDGLSVLPLGDEAPVEMVITINDYAAASAAMGVDPPPDDAGAGEARDWIDQLFGGRLDLQLPEFLGNTSATNPHVVEAEFGWSPYDIEVSAELLPLDEDSLGGIAVLLGDLAWVGAFDLGDGVGSIGDGADGARDDEQRSDLRPLGRPLRTGARNGQIAAATSTDLMRTWIGGDFDDAGSDAGMLSAAERLDAVDAYTARLFRADFAVDGTDGLAAAVVDEPFDVVAIGLSGEFSELSSTLVYVFADNDSAGRAVQQIEAGWRALDLSGLDETFEITMIEQRDDAVVVIGRVEDGRTSDDVFEAAREAGLLRHT